MGQQRRLLMILGKFVVGIALVISALMFSDDAVSGDRDALCSDLAHIAARAHQYYRLPAALGGGGRSFVGLTADAAGSAKVIPWPNGRNANGIYYIGSAGTANMVEIGGWGQDIDSTGNRLEMRIIVRDQGRPDSLFQVY